MEKSNQELYDKMIEGFNKILQETHQLKNDTFEIIDKNIPNYNNIRKIYDMCYETQEKINKIENRLNSIEIYLKQLNNK